MGEAGAGITGTLVEASTEAVIIRCGCAGGPLHAGVECPHPVYIDLGTVSSWRASPARRVLAKIRKHINKG